LRSAIFCPEFNSLKLYFFPQKVSGHSAHPACFQWFAGMAMFSVVRGNGLKMAMILHIFSFLVTFCLAQRNDAELFSQQQEAFCLLWKNSRIDQQYSLSTLCFRRVRKFGDQVQTQLFAIY
jgi:hypothetical protein